MHLAAVVINTESPGENKTLSESKAKWKFEVVTVEQKAPELSAAQLEFLAGIHALGKTITIETAKALPPLDSGELLDLIDLFPELKPKERNGNKEIRLPPDFPESLIRKFGEIRTPAWVSMMLDKLNDLHCIDQISPEIHAILLAECDRIKEAAQINNRLAQVALENHSHIEALKYSRRALIQLGSNLGSRGNDSLFISAALELSNLAVSLGKYLNEMPQILEKAKGISNRLGDKRSTALLELHMGRVYFFSNNLSKALEFFALGEMAVKNLGDDDILEQASQFLALYHHTKGNFGKAMEYFELALIRLGSQKVNALADPSSVIYMGLTSAYLGQFQRAIGLLDFNWRLTKGHSPVSPIIRAILGTVLVVSGNRENGSFHLQMAHKEALSDRNFLGEYFAVGGLAYYHLIENRPNESRDMLTQLQARAIKHGMLGRFWSPWTLEMLFELEKLGYTPIPGYEFENLLSVIMDTPNAHLRGLALRLNAEKKLHQGISMDSIEKDLLASETLLKSTGDLFQVAKTRIALATLKLSQGNQNEALVFAQEARQGLSGALDVFFPDGLRFLLDDHLSDTEDTDHLSILAGLFYEMAKQLLARPSLQYAMQLLVSTMNRFLGAERGALFWSAEGKSKSLELTASLNLSKNEVSGESFDARMRLVLKSLREGKPSIFRTRHALLCLPIKVEGLGAGVLYCDNSYFPHCFDFLSEPVLERVMTETSKHLSWLRHYHQLLDQKEKWRVKDLNNKLERIGQDIKFSSPIMRKLLEQADRIATSEATVSIQGETGVGKELLAKRIHNMSRRGDGPFVTIDPSTIPENLLESELFGYEKGAFTGANHQKIGRMEAAHQGTLFIDEIGEIPQALQVKFLRVLEEQKFPRIGGKAQISIDFRLLVATNRDLKKEVEKGRFRNDLYYRINVVPLKLPALQDRTEDIVMLAEYFLEYYCKKNMTGRIALNADDNAKLCAYAWPGNVRELKNVMERTALLGSSEHWEFLSQAKPKATFDDIFADDVTLDELQRRYIRYTLDKTGGKMGGSGGAAELLGMKRTSLYARMKKLGLSPKQ